MHLNHAKQPAPRPDNKSVCQAAAQTDTRYGHRALKSSRQPISEGVLANCFPFPWRRENQFILTSAANEPPQAEPSLTLALSKPYHMHDVACFTYLGVLSRLQDFHTFVGAPNSATKRKA